MGDGVIKFGWIQNDTTIGAVLFGDPADWAEVSVWGDEWECRLVENDGPVL